jgi:hypothetical protein
MQSMRSQRASSVPFDTLIVQKLLQEVKRVMFGGGCTEFRQLQRTTKIIIISSSPQQSQQEGKEENNKQNESPYLPGTVLLCTSYNTLPRRIVYSYLVSTEPNNRDCIIC